MHSTVFNFSCKSLFLSVVKLFFVFIFLSLFWQIGIAMSLFTHPEEDIVLFSEMKGHITFNGKPAENATIERWIKWKDEEGETDTFTTDDRGAFYLPTVKVKARLPKLGEFVVHQEVRVFYQGKEFLIWGMGKMSKKLHGELGGRPINFHCELSNEAIRVEVENGLLGTSCKWDLIEQTIKD